MGFSGNFKEVVLAGAQVVVVGVSDPTDLPISVTLVHKGHVVTRAIGVADGDWSITFPAGDEPYELGDMVHLTGIAIQPDNAEPFVWPGHLEIRAAPA
jgi:hypothetical protein